MPMMTGSSIAFKPPLIAPFPSSLAGMITGVTTLISPLYSNPTITGPAGGFTFTSAYPSGDLWEDHSRELFQATDTSGQEVWMVWISPNEDPLPMQLFVFEIQIGGAIVPPPPLIP